MVDARLEECDDQLRKLAQEQGVRPIGNVDELRGDPIEDLEDFLEVITAARRGEALSLHGHREGGAMSENKERREPELTREETIRPVTDPKVNETIARYGKWSMTEVALRYVRPVEPGKES